MQPYFDILNSFFDKIYVITLRRAIERQEAIKKELAGLNYSFFYGKDKADFTTQELEEKDIYNEALAQKHHRHGKALSTGMVCCSWSHALVYEDVVKNNYNKVLIMEDDVRIDEKKIELLPQIFAELPQDWELLYLGYCLNEHPPSNVVFKKVWYHLLRFFGGIRFSHTTIKNLYPKRASHHLFYAGYHDCIHAYGITQSAAQKLLQLQTPISFIADNLVAHAATNELVKAFITKPKIINQQSQVSAQPIRSFVNE